ncbi:MAG: J domain-containing protein [Synergistaceae bacterium]|nr:J domain-containing protein [Synergistaceae bacterium]
MRGDLLMPHDRNYYYKILGLEPGATPEEIKTAFRRLVKFYHPDRGSSFDAEMMYKEIHEAYKTLIEQPFGETCASHTSGHHHPKREAHHYSNHSSGKTRQAADDHDWEEWATRMSGIPFELKNLPSIFSSSLNEMSIENFILALGCAYLSCDPIGFNRFTRIAASLQPYSKLVILFYIVSWIFLILLRYYFAHFLPSALAFLMRFVAGVLYGLMLVFLITCFYTVPEGSLFLVGSLAAVSAWALMLDFKKYRKMH